MRQWGSSEEQHIEQSKSHWSVLAEAGADGHGHEIAELSNVQVFDDLRHGPNWGHFVRRWDDFASVNAGKKFAEGAQAELFHCKVEWVIPKGKDPDLHDERKWVLKVDLKKGTFLRNLQSQLPQGLLQFYDVRTKNLRSPTPRVPRYPCQVNCGVLLEDGRFGFLME